MSNTRPANLLSTTWVVGVIAYSFVRALVAWPTLGQYGVNPWVFLAIDLITAPPYAIGQVKIVRAFARREWTTAQMWIGIVAVTFLAPYAYIVLAGSGSMPLLAYVILAALVLLFGLASAFRLRSQIREARVSEVEDEV